MKLAKKIMLSLGMFLISTSSVLASPVTEPTTSSQVNSQETIMETSIDLSNVKHGETIVLSDGAVLTPMSQEKYVEKLAKEKSITIDEAYALEQKTSKAGERAIYYYEYSKEFDYSIYYSAVLEADIKCWTDGRYTQIEDVLSVSTRRSSGWGEYSWEESDAYADSTTGVYPSGKVNLVGKGNFEVRVHKNANIGAELNGFTIGGSAGSDSIYISDTLRMEGSYKTY